MSVSSSIFCDFNRSISFSSVSSLFSLLSYFRDIIFDRKVHLEYSRGTQIFPKWMAEKWKDLHTMYANLSNLERFAYIELILERFAYIELILERFANN